MDYIACCGTDIGTKRASNQDSVSVKVQVVNGIKNYFLIVCDGVGGLSMGEYASKSVRESLERWFLYEYPGLIGIPDGKKSILEQLRREILTENEILFTYGQERGLQLGTTVSALLLTERHYYIAHVGDSRIYRLGRELIQITEDQTLIERKIRQGLLTREQAKREPGQNIILQCVGSRPDVEVLLYHGEYSPDEGFMVCSDGFYHRIRQKEIIKSFYGKKCSSTERLGQEIKRQIRRVKRRGERDNISVAVIRKERVR